MTIRDEFLAQAGVADATNQHGYAQHLRNKAANDGICSGCNYCCDRCNYDGHYCNVCNDAVSHNHSHDGELGGTDAT